MLPLVSKKMRFNDFVETQLPTKSQIFARTGQRAVSPAGMYTGDDPAVIGSSQTEIAERFVRSAESYERPQPQTDKPSGDEE